MNIAIQGFYNHPNSFSGNFKMRLQFQEFIHFIYYWAVHIKMIPVVAMLAQEEVPGLGVYTIRCAEDGGLGGPGLSA
jgi:hypothetical protein